MQSIQPQVHTRGDHPDHLGPADLIQTSQLEAVALPSLALSTETTVKPLGSAFSSFLLQSPDQPLQVGLRGVARPLLWGHVSNEDFPSKALASPCHHLTSVS